MYLTFETSYFLQLVLGGFGPGAVVALWSLLSVKWKGPRPDGLILANCWAPSSLKRPKNMETLRGLPMLVIIGGKDPIVPFDMQHKLAETLKKLGFNVSVCLSPEVSHAMKLETQGPAIRDFMLRLIHAHDGMHIYIYVCMHACLHACMFFLFFPICLQVVQA